MKLLKMLSNVVNDNDNFVSYIQRSREILEDRLDWLYDREPESDGMVHDEWQDKYDDLEEIIDMFDDFDTDQSISKWKEIASAIISYQNMYGGLSRIEI